MNDEFRTFSFWVDFMRRTWCPSRWPLIDLFLDAGRVRENWLQADLYLAVQTSASPTMPNFCCNCPPRGFGGTADWSYWTNQRKETHRTDPSRPLMVAEVKFLGGSYKEKGLAGESYRPGQFLVGADRLPFLVCPDHPLVKEGTCTGLIGDYLRLARYRHPSDPLRLLVLLLDKRSEGTPLGQCLRQVEFDGAGTVVIDTPLWLCKAWQVRGYI